MSQSTCPHCGLPWNSRFRTTRGQLLCTDCIARSKPLVRPGRWLGVLVFALVLATLAGVAITVVR